MDVLERLERSERDLDMARSVQNQTCQLQVVAQQQLLHVESTAGLGVANCCARDSKIRGVQLGWRKVWCTLQRMGGGGYRGDATDACQWVLGGGGAMDTCQWEVANLEVRLGGWYIQLGSGVMQRIARWKYDWG